MDRQEARRPGTAVMGRTQQAIVRATVMTADVRSYIAKRPADTTVVRKNRGVVRNDGNITLALEVDTINFCRAELFLGAHEN
jgi:hypothetical protein